MDNNVAGLITDTANKYGEDPSTALRIAQVETGGRNIDNASSGAAGVYQFMPATWAQYGNGADPHDLAANVDAGLRLLRDNRTGLQKALGRDPTPSEVYLAHQQGLGGATALLKNPTMAAATLVGAKAVQGNGGDLGMTAGEFTSKWANKFDGSHDNAPGYVPRTVAYSDLMAPPSPAAEATPTTNPEADLSPDDLKPAWDYFKSENLTATAIRRAFLDPSFAPDPNFAPTSDDVKRYATAPDGSMLPPEYLSRFASATSDAQAKWIAQRSFEELNAVNGVEKLGNGWNRTGIKLATMLLDPTSILAGVATDGVMSPATAALARYGMAGKVAGGALVGGVSNVAITAAQRTLDGDPVVSSDAGYLNALALGMTLGGAFGPLAHGYAASANEAPPLANALVSAGKSLREHVEAKEAGVAAPVEHEPLTPATDPHMAPPAAPGGPANLSVGAAFDPFAHTPLELKTGEWTDVRDEGQFKSNLAVDDKVPALASNALLPSTGTQTASSPFAEHRMFGAFLAGNPLGYVKEANPIDAALTKDHIRNSLTGQMNRFLKPAFDEWATRQGYSNLQRMTKRPEFMAQAHDYLTKADPARTYDPAVMRYVDQGVRPVYRSLAEELRRTGVAEELILSADYFPRLYDPNKVGAAYHEFGTGVMSMAAKEALRSMPWAEGLDPARLDTIARGYVSGIAKRAMNLDDNGRALAGRDLERLHSVLMEDAGLSHDEARSVVDTMHQSTEDPSRGTARLKDRVDLDTSARVTLPDGRSLSLSDLVSKDVGFITERYVDQMAGRIALADMHVVDPSTGDTILKGVRSDADFDKALGDARRNIQERYIDKAATAKERTNLEQWRDYGEANLRFMYDRVMSKPLNAAPGAFGRALRLLRKYTFVRIMGATGWSHLSIFASNLGNGGLAAIEHAVPAFRRIMSEDGEWIRAHGLDRELEAVFGNHTDPMRGLQMLDWGNDPTAGISRVDRAERALDQMSKVTAVASGLSHIVDMNTRWAQKIIAQKFANMAHGATELADGTLSASGANMKRMLQLGLDEPMLQRVLREVKDHATTEQGILFDHKLTKLNLDQWDQETAYRFQAAVARYAGRVVQENDVGSSARWISNPAWQLFMQFRNFPMVGMTKQLTYNLVMHDREAAQYAMTAMAISALIYTAKEQVNSIGRSDRQEYLAKRLAPGEVARAMAHHSGLFGLMPAFLDTGMRMAGTDALFDFRSTGNPSALWSAPGLSTLDDASKAVEGVWKPIAENRTRSQAETRALMRMLPWNNTLPGTLLTNAMISGLPLHGPSRSYSAH